MLNKVLPALAMLYLLLAAGMSYRAYFEQAGHDRPQTAKDVAGKPEAAPATLEWVTGYWYSPPAWGGLPVAGIDYSPLTHIIHQALSPTGDGGFEASSLEYITSYAADLVRTAHRHKVKVLLGVNQTRPGPEFLNASAPAVLPAFAGNILRLVEKYGYDGVDLDWETRVDAGRFEALVHELRRRLNALRPKRLLTGAFWEARYVAPVYSEFDQVNVMAYDGSSVAHGFSWHNAAIHSGREGRPSTDWRLGQFRAIPPSRLGLGIPFYGYIWKGGAGTPTGGVTAPAQTWTKPPAVRSASYKAIVTDRALWRNARQHRDATAGVPFLSIDLPGADDDMFVTYDDEVSVAAKVAYARAKHLGGVMIFDLSGDYLPGHHPEHPLLQALAKALECSPREPKRGN